MKRLLVTAVVLAAASRAHATPPSDPAYLGSVLDDRNVCLIKSVSEGGPAAASGLAAQDLIEAIDGVAIGACNEVIAQVIAHAPGDEIVVQVMRGDRQVRLRARLASRTEVLQRRYVAKPVPDFAVKDYDDGHAVDLARPSGETRVLAWYDARHCDGCASILERIGSKTKLEVVTYGTSKELASDHLTGKLGVPVALLDTEDEFDETGLGESDRAYFMVVDCRGIVRFVLPILPAADDADAAIDDVLAAVEQTEHARRR